jgi:hypothetical protein
MLRSEIRKIIKEEFKSLRKDIVNDVINHLMGVDEIMNEVVTQSPTVSTNSKSPKTSKVCYECKREDRSSFPNPNYRCLEMDCEYYIETKY